MSNSVYVSILFIISTKIAKKCPIIVFRGIIKSSGLYSKRT